MKTLLLLVIAAAFSVAPVFAQDTPVDTGVLGADTAQQNIQEISVNRFEDPGFWVSSIPVDRGIVSHRRILGGPADKEPIEAEVAAGIEAVDDYVIGLRANFYRRGETQISLRPIRPIHVPGLVKTLSVWVVGRNMNHHLSLVVEDYFGNVRVLPMGRLNHTGWRLMTVAVPPGLRMQDPHFPMESGLKVRGFLIDSDIDESYGTMYVYFDDMRAVTDLFAEQSRDPDDMVDGW